MINLHIPAVKYNSPKRNGILSIFNENYVFIIIICVCTHASGRLLKMITFQGKVGSCAPNDLI